MFGSSEAAMAAQSDNAYFICILRLVESLEWRFRHGIVLAPGDP